MYYLMKGVRIKLFYAYVDDYDVQLHVLTNKNLKILYKVYILG